MRELSRAINDYLESKPGAEKVFIESLWDNIFEAVKGQRQSRCTMSMQEFRFSYSCDTEETLHLLPDDIKWYGIRKDFIDALGELYDHLISKIQERHPETIMALTGSDIDKIKWIRSSLGIVISNKVFNEEKNRYRREYNAVLGKINKAFKNKNFFTFESTELFLAEILDDRIHQMIRQNFRSIEMACWVLSKTAFSDQEVINWIEQNYNEVLTIDTIRANTKRVNQKIVQHIIEPQGKDTPFRDDTIQPVDSPFLSPDHFVQNGDGDDIEGYAKSHDEFVNNDWIIHRLIEKESETESDEVNIIEWQKEVFFWKPGKTILGKTAQATRAMYIAFFYAWLRRCSFANNSEIAQEVGVVTSSVIRWKPELRLREPFPDVEGVFFPVYFDEPSRNSLGLFDQTLRCYSKEDYGGADYFPVLKRKEALWHVYGLLRDTDRIDEIEASFDKNNAFSNELFQYSLEIMLNEDLGIHPRRSYSVLCIRDMEVN